MLIMLALYPWWIIMTRMISTISALFIGAIITFLTTLATGVLIERYRHSQKRKSVSLRLKLELSQTTKALDDIRAQQSRQRWYDYHLIDILDQSVSNLQSMRQDISLFKSDKLQEKIYDLIIKVVMLAKNMRSVQDFEYDKNSSLSEDDKANKQKLIEENRIKNDVDLIDLKRDIESLISHVR